MLLYWIFIFAMGLTGLVIGSDVLVRKSSFLARLLKVRPELVGLLLLGMGTSAPEWAVSALASLKGLPALAVGNVLGSNIFNILIVFSLILLNPALGFEIKYLKKDFLFLILSSLLLPVLFADYFLSFIDGLVLAGVFISYIAMCFYFAGQKGVWPYTTGGGGFLKKAGKELNQAPDNDACGRGLVLGLGLGAALLIGGSYLTVQAGGHLGRLTGLDERVIGIVLVSIGSSLPELFTVGAALFRREKGLAAGSLIGSNIFNTYAVLGTSALILPSDLKGQVLALDLPLLLGVYVLFSLLLFKKTAPAAARGLPYIFLTVYLVYISCLLY